MTIDLLVPPDLRSIDLDAAPGERSGPMLERAHEALATWVPRDETDAEARARVRGAREVRRGERSAEGGGPLVERSEAERTSEADVDRILDAEGLAVDVAARGTVTLADLGSLHAIVVGADGPLPWRTDVIWMGDRSGPDTSQPFQPAAPERIPAAMDELERFLARSGDPVVRAAVAFAQLPVIHPWADGNGRVGRLLGDMTLGAGLPHGGRSPRVSDHLARMVHATRLGLDAWRATGDLDSWVAMYAGAVIQCCESNGQSTRKWRLMRRRTSP
jgi:hypothetical protein